MKKMIHTLRNRLVTGVQLSVPVIFTIMALSIELAIPKVKDEPPLTLDLQPFGNGLLQQGIHRVCNRNRNTVEWLSIKIGCYVCHCSCSTSVRF
jgi:hypothetical protein